MSRRRILVTYLLNVIFCVVATFAGCAVLLEHGPRWLPTAGMMALATPVIAPVVSPFITARALYLAVLRPELLEWSHVPAVICLPAFCALVYTAIMALRRHEQRGWLVASHLLLLVFWATGSLVTKQAMEWFDDLVGGMSL